MTRLVFALLLAVAACGQSSSAPASEQPLAVGEGCQPLLATARPGTQASCILPYPSDFHRAPDPSTATGQRVLLRGDAKLRRATGEVVDPHDVYVADGASAITPIVATLPSAIVREGLPGLRDPSVSAQAASPTLLLDVERGELVAHHADVHVNADDPTQTPLVLRPLAPLRPRARYVVALAGVRDTEGVAAPAEGFRRLRDRNADPALAVHDRFEADVFEPLARAGIARDRLQLAWDFTTGSKEQPERDLLRVRELTGSWLATSAPAVTVVERKDDGDFRRVELEVTGPSFLTEPSTRAILARDAAGAVVQNGTTTFRLLVRIPAAVRDGATAGRLVAIGHGFFGGRGEIDGGAVKEISRRLGAVVYGIDWHGMSAIDRGPVIDGVVDDPAHVADFSERVHQGIASWLVANALLRGAATTLPDLLRVDGGPAWDPAHPCYFGASLGHVLGGTLAGVDPSFGRVALNVGGGGFTHIMPRSANFAPFAILMRGVFGGDPLLLQIMIAAMQRPLDRIDPITWAPHVGSKVLIQTGLGDPAVPNAAAFLHARALGAKQTMPAPLAIPGIAPSNGGEPGSAITLFDYGIDTSTMDVPLPLGDPSVHEAVRREDAAIRQLDAFLRPDGVVLHPCDGPCDPQ